MPQYTITIQLSVVTGKHKAEVYAAAYAAAIDAADSVNKAVGALTVIEQVKAKGSGR